MKISLDTNVFSDQDFIDWLHINKDSFEIYLSVIVKLETFHWYNLRKLDKSKFENDINKLGVNVVEVLKHQVYNISSNALNSHLRFKNHARDFIIGTHSSEVGSVLITRNIKHFKWLTNNQIMTPEDLVMKISN